MGRFGADEEKRLIENEYWSIIESLRNFFKDWYLIGVGTQADIIISSKLRLVILPDETVGKAILCCQ